MNREDRGEIGGGGEVEIKWMGTGGEGVRGVRGGWDSGED